MQLGQKIKLHRLTMNLNQKEFGQLIKVKSKTYVSSIENGNLRPSINVLARIASVLGISIEELLEEEN